MSKSPLYTKIRVVTFSVVTLRVKEVVTFCVKIRYNSSDRFFLHFSLVVTFRGVRAPFSTEHSSGGVLPQA